MLGLLSKSSALDTFDMLDSLVLEDWTADGRDNGLRGRQKTIINQVHGRIDAEDSSKDDSAHVEEPAAQTMQPPVFLQEDENGHFPGLGAPMTG